MRGVFIHSRGTDRDISYNNCQNCISCRSYSLLIHMRCVNEVNQIFVVVTQPYFNPYPANVENMVSFYQWVRGGAVG